MNLRSADQSFAIEELIGTWKSRDPFDYDLNAIRELQLRALNDRLGDHRRRLKVLDQRAGSQNVDHVSQLGQAVPLLFSHTTYKSYPASFITKGRWDLMTRWLGTLSTHPTDSLGLKDVGDIAGWIGAMRKSGHEVIASSGTTGSSSYVNSSAEDIAIHGLNIRRATEAANGVIATPRYRYFWAGPRHGFNVAALQNRLSTEIFARPGEVYYLSEDEVSIADMDRLASIRKAVIEGTATPQLLADAEHDSARRMAALESNIKRFIEILFKQRDEPIALFTGFSMLWRIVREASALGLSKGLLHPDSIIKTGGGMKGFRGAGDFREEAAQLLGIPQQQWVETYGMTEMNTQFVKCSHGRYHCPASTILLLLDKAGESLIDTSSGVVEGRGGFFDITLDRRWGGVISGDKLTVDFDLCRCGRKSPGVIAISRYSDLPEGDDKLTCAGQIDSYVRGFAGGDWEA